MKTSKLVKTHSCFNPYYLKCENVTGKQVERMHFFKDGAILATHNRGWLSMYGSNNGGNDVLENIEFRNKRKADLSAKYSFFIGDEVYINCAELPDFLFATDMVELSTKENICYGNRIYFTCGATDERHEHLTRSELRSFMVGCYSRVVPTDYGLKVKAVVSVFDDAGVTVSPYDASKMLDNSDSILAVMA
jgi:hypothetical protein